MKTETYNKLWVNTRTFIVETIDAVVNGDIYNDIEAIRQDIHNFYTDSIQHYYENEDYKMVYDIAIEASQYTEKIAQHIKDIVVNEYGLKDRHITNM